MTHDFPYLKDSSFLKRFDKQKLKEQYAKIIVLTFNETPIQEIQGKVTGGSFNVDGSSAMRRTANISIVTDEYENDLTDTKHLLSINKKVEILVGFDNTTDEYQAFPILWFPQGTYVITAPNITHNAQGVSIALTLHDKMCLLNGECGGVLPASVVFNEVEDIDENGEIQIRELTIYQIIQELVNHFGKEQLGKIIISDVDSRIKKVMKWTGSTPLYHYWRALDDGTVYHHFSTNYQEVQNLKNRDGGEIEEFDYGEDVGYILTDFVYPGDLISNAGDTITSILDKIKSVLGNYEYFYDTDGNFRFQEIKNYLNTSYSTTKIENMEASDYLVDFTSGKSVYTFEDAEIVQSYANTPQYLRIKNDFMVWGKRTSMTGKEIPIRYHLAINKRPEVGNSYQVFFFTDPDDNLEKARVPLQFSSKSQFPKKGEVTNYYYAADTGRIYKWASDVGAYELTPYVLETVTSTDYRTELYLAGAASEPLGLDSNDYYAELKNEWPKIYDVRNQRFKPEVEQQPDDIDFFLDIIDTTAAISELSVENIGRRTNVLTNDKINCIFEPDNPDIVMIEAGSPDAEEIREECEARNQEYSQVRPEVYDMLLAGGALRSAYEEIRTELYQFTSYNEQITLTTLPIYYLEPNVRITVRDAESGIYGDYMIKSYSLPLDINGTMSISCTRALERI